MVYRFYVNVLEDSRISRFFADVDFGTQIAKQTAFMGMAFGGPNEYEGKDLREAHAHLVEKGLNDSHVDAFIEVFAKTLKEYEYSQDIIEQALEIVESKRDYVLGRAP